MKKRQGPKTWFNRQPITIRGAIVGGIFTLLAALITIIAGEFRPVVIVSPGLGYETATATAIVKPADTPMPTLASPTPTPVPPMPTSTSTTIPVTPTSVIIPTFTPTLTCTPSPKPPSTPTPANALVLDVAMIGELTPMAGVLYAEPVDLVRQSAGLEEVSQEVLQQGTPVAWAGLTTQVTNMSQRLDIRLSPTVLLSVTVQAHAFKSPPTIVAFMHGGPGWLRHTVIACLDSTSRGVILLPLDKEAEELLSGEPVPDFFVLKPGELETFNTEIWTCEPGSYQVAAGVEFFVGTEKKIAWQPPVTVLGLPAEYDLWTITLEHHGIVSDSFLAGWVTQSCERAR